MKDSTNLDAPTLRAYLRRMRTRPLQPSPHGWRATAINLLILALGLAAILLAYRFPAAFAAGFAAAALLLFFVRSARGTRAELRAGLHPSQLPRSPIHSDDTPV
jgi:hypothetical protein